MRVNDDYRDCNTESQMHATGEDLSVWQCWQRALAQRKEHSDVFIHGEYETVDWADETTVFAYLRTGKKSGKWLVVLNWSGEVAQWRTPEKVKVEGWMAGNYQKGKPDKKLEGTLELRPWEGVLGRCRD